jgi:hypothetical protein
LLVTKLRYRARCPLTLIAGLGHGMMGSVDFHTLVSLLAGSLPGIFVGGSISARVPDTALRYVMAAVLIVDFCPAESECCGGPYDTSFHQDAQLLMSVYLR